MLKKLFLLLVVFLLVGMLSGVAMACDDCGKGNPVGQGAELLANLMVPDWSVASAIGIKQINKRFKGDGMFPSFEVDTFIHIDTVLAMSWPGAGGATYLPDINKSIQENIENFGASA